MELLSLFKGTAPDCCPENGIWGQPNPFGGFDLIMVASKKRIDRRNIQEQIQ